MSSIAQKQYIVKGLGRNNIFIFLKKPIDKSNHIWYTYIRLKKGEPKTSPQLQPQKLKLKRRLLTMSNQNNNEMMSDNSKTYETAMALIASNKAVPKEFQDEFSVYEMIAENNKLEEMNGLTVQPLVIFYNEETYRNEETGENETDLKTYLLAQLEDGSCKMFNGFSLTFRLKIELLQGVFKTKLPKISVSKVSKGMKQEYVIKPIRG